MYPSERAARRHRLIVPACFGLAAAVTFARAEPGSAAGDREHHAIAVTFRSPGASPVDLERTVLGPVESAIARTAMRTRIKRTESTARDGLARVIVYVDSGDDRTVAAREIGRAIADLRDRPGPPVDAPVIAPVEPFASREQSLAGLLRAGAEGAVLALLVVLAFGSASRVAQIAVRLDGAMDRYHDALAWALDHRVATVVVAGCSLAAVAFLHPTVGARSVVRLGETMAIATPRGGLDALDPLRSRTRPPIRLDVRGADWRTLIGVAHRVADEVRRVPGASLVSVSTDGEIETNGLAQIDHLDGERVVRVYTEIDGRERRDVITDIDARLARAPLPPGYRVSHEGARDQAIGTTTAAAFAVVAALVLTLLVLTVQLRSIGEPAAVLVSLLLTPAGVLGALLATRQPFSVMSVVAILSAMGIVAWGATSLLHSAVRRRDHGASERVALVESARESVRPVLTCAVATAAAALPLALGNPEGPEGWSPLGVAIAGGALASAPLILLVSPAACAIFVDLELRGRAWLALRAQVRAPFRPDPRD